MPNLSYIKTLTSPITQLGEGLYYCEKEIALYWVDILKPRLFRQDLNNDSLAVYDFDEAISWVNKDINGRLIIGCFSGIYAYDISTQHKHLVWQNAQKDNNVRLNDAKCHVNGQLFFGTMDHDEQEPKGELYSIDQNGQIVTVDTGYIVTNGPAISHLDDTIYSVASAERTVYKLKLNQTTIQYGKSVFIEWNEADGFPDGLTIDSEGNIWIASWGGSAVYCYDKSGTLLNKVQVPAPFVTNITFGGEDMKDVYVTSAVHPMTKQQVEQYPNAGKVFHFRADAPGLLEPAIRYLPS